MKAFNMIGHFFKVVLKQIQSSKRDEQLIPQSTPKVVTQGAIQSIADCYIIKSGDGYVVETNPIQMGYSIRRRQIALRMTLEGAIACAKEIRRNGFEAEVLYSPRKSALIPLPILKSSQEEQLERKAEILGKEMVIEEEIYRQMIGMIEATR